MQYAMRVGRNVGRVTTAKRQGFGVERSSLVKSQMAISLRLASYAGKRSPRWWSPMKFDLQKNVLKTKLAPNPNTGKQHNFIAYRLKGDPKDAVT
jgi:hypothetical protein